MTDAATPPSGPPTAPPQHEVHDWISRTVYDAEGVPLGRCTRVFSDLATDVPEWLGIALDGGEQIVVVPVVGARRQGDEVTVAVTRAAVERAPLAGTGEVIPVGEEERLYQHYGIARSTERSPTGLPATGPASSTPDEAAAPSRLRPVPVGEPPDRPATSDAAAHQPLVGLSSDATAGGWRRRATRRMPVAAALTALAGVVAAAAARRRRSRPRRPVRVVARLRTR